MFQFFCRWFLFFFSTFFCPFFPHVSLLRWSALDTRFPYPTSGGRITSKQDILFVRLHMNCSYLPVGQLTLAVGEASWWAPLFSRWEATGCGPRQRPTYYLPANLTTVGKRKSVKLEHWMSSISSLDLTGLDEIAWYYVPYTLSYPPLRPELLADNHCILTPMIPRCRHAHC